MALPLRLLLVDDQPDSVITLIGHLEACGHRLVVCSDPLEALRRIATKHHEREPFHLIFSDLNMPGIDGQGLVRELRLRGDTVPVVFITGYNSLAVRLHPQMDALKVLGFLTKPPALAEVDRYLEHAARTSRATAQDRRSSEFGLGSGGHSMLPAPGSGGHPLVGNVPGSRTASTADPFYGTSRTFRAKYTTPEPTEGALSRVVKPPLDAGIIPDHVITGSHAPPPPNRSTSGIRNLRTPLPAAPGPGDGLTPLRPKKLDPSGFYYAPNEVTGTTPQPGDIPTLKPQEGFLDPVTGQIKRPPSAIFPPEAPIYKRQPSSFYPAESPIARPAQPGQPGQAAQPAQPPLSQRFSRSVAPQPPQRPIAQPVAEPGRPGTTSRFRRSVGEAPQPGTQPGTPPVAPSSGLTSRIRRGITQAPPIAAPPGPELPTCAVACAHCQHQFNVVIKAESYTVICVYCGQLNRIDPL